MFLQPLVTSSDGNSLPAILSQAATMLCLPLALPVLVSSHHRQPPWPPLASPGVLGQRDAQAQGFLSCHHILFRSHLLQAATLFSLHVQPATHLSA